MSIAAFFFYNSSGATCVNEFQHVTTGTFHGDKECCDGLTKKSPEGFSGGAWCMSGRYDVKCLTPTTTNHIQVEGIYAVERVQENSGAKIILKEMSCWS